MKLRFFLPFLFCLLTPVAAQNIQVQADATTGLLWRPAALFTNATNVSTIASSLSATFQPLDSDLTAIAALSTTAYGRSFLALADAAAARTLLGLSSADSPQFTALTLTGNLNTSDGFTVLSAGSIALTAGGTNENITLTPSGTGVAIASTGLRINAANALTLNNSANNGGSTLANTGGSGSTETTFTGSRLITTGAFAVASTTASTSTTTGALVTAGGLGVAGALNVGSTIDQYRTDTTTSSNHWFVTGANRTWGIGQRAGDALFHVYDGLNSQSRITVSANNASGTVAINGTTASTSYTTGALTVAGGVGVVGNAFIGGDLNVYKSTVSSVNLILTAAVNNDVDITMQFWKGATPAAQWTMGNDSTTNNWVLAEGGVLGTNNAIVIADSTRDVTIGSDLTVSGGDGTFGGTTATNPTLTLNAQDVTGNASFLSWQSGGSTKWLMKAASHTDGDLWSIGQATGATTLTPYLSLAYATGNATFGGDVTVSKNGGALTLATTSDPANYFLKFQMNYSSSNPWSITSGNQTPFDLKNYSISGVSGASLNITNYYGITFHAGLVADSTPAMVITSAGNVDVRTTTASTSTTTGALTVAGGVGVAGAGYFGGLVQSADRVVSFSGYPGLNRWGGSSTLPTLEYASNSGIRFNTGTTQYEFVNGGTVTAYLGTSGGSVTGDLTVSGGNVGVGGASSSSVGLNILSALSGANTIGFGNSPTITATANSQSFYGAYFQPTFATATYTDLTAYGARFVTPTITGTGTIGTSVGIAVGNQGAAGVNNAYGIDIAAQSGAATTNVGLRNAGTTLLTNTTASTSTTTGALVVSGGVGIGGNLAQTDNTVHYYGSYLGENSIRYNTPTLPGFLFKTQGTDRMMLVGGTGNLLLGTTSDTASYLLNVTRSSGNAYIGIGNQSGVAGDRYLRLGFASAGTTATIQGTRVGIADDINVAMQAGGGNVLLGTTTDSSNGKLQLASHTTAAGGIGLGTEISLYRVTASTLQITGTTDTSLSIGGAGTGNSLFGVTNNAGYSSYFGHDGTGAYIQANNSQPFRITTGGVAALSIDNTQNATFSGAVSASTPAAGTNSTVVPTTAWVNTALANKTNSLAAAQGLVFDGTAGATVANISAFGTGDFTAAAWVNVPALAAAPGMCVFGGDTTSFSLFIEDSGTLRAYRTNASASGPSTGTVTAGKAALIAYVRSGTTGTYYINGVAAGTITDSSDYGSGTVKLGQNTIAGNYFFHGTLRPLAYNRALSASEITALSEQGAPAASDYPDAPAGVALNTSLTADQGSPTIGSATAVTFTGSPQRVKTPDFTYKTGTTVRVTGTMASFSGTEVRVYMAGGSTYTITADGAFSLDVVTGTAGTNAVYIDGAAGSGAITGLSVMPLGLLLAPDSAQAGAGLVWYDTSGNAANITLPSTGVEWVLPAATNAPLAGNLVVPDGFTVSSAGSIALTAGGTNESVELTPSGTGDVKANRYLRAMAVTTGLADPVDGKSLELVYSSDDDRGYVTSYDRTGAAFKPLTISASAVTIGQGDVTVSATTEATTGGAGSLTTAGGIYAAKKVISGSGVLTLGTDVNLTRFTTNTAKLDANLKMLRDAADAALTITRSDSGNEKRNTLSTDSDSSLVFNIDSLSNGTASKVFKVAFTGVDRFKINPDGDTTLLSGQLIVSTAKTPSSASDTGVAGTICWDANYIYVCTATNTWKRVAIATW